MEEESIGVVTDSTCDLPENLLQQYNIKVVPLRIYFDNTEYIDGETLKKDRFYELLNSSKTIPTTSQPSPSDFLNIYNKIKAEGINKIISLHISSDLSGTVNAAKMAKDFLKEVNMNIEVIDSRTISMGLGLLVIEAAKLSQKKADLSEIKQKIREDITKIKLYFATPSLKYLQKGGRISRIAVILGESLRTVPMLAVKDGKGEIELVKKCKKENLVKELTNLAQLEDETKKITEPIHILYTPPDQYVQELESALKNTFPNLIIIKEIGGCIVGSHVGPAALGIALNVA